MALTVAVTGCAAGTSASRPAAAPRSPSAVVPLHVAAYAAPWHLRGEISRAVAFWRRGRIVMAGGLLPGDVSTSQVLAYSAQSGAVTRVASLLTAVHDAAAATVGGRDLVLGGGAAVGMGAVQTVGSRPQTVGELPQPRSDLSAVTIGSHAYVLGGYTGSALPTQILATSNGHDFRTVGRLPLPVRYAAVVAVGSAILIFGGQDANGRAVATVQRFDTATDTASVVGHPSPRLSGAVAVDLAGRVLLAGGRLPGGQASAAVRQWNPTTRRLPVVARLPAAVANAAIASDGTHAWLLGGEAAAPLNTVQIVSVEPVRR